MTQVRKPVLMVLATLGIMLHLIQRIDASGDDRATLTSKQILTEAEDMQDWLVSTRRDLHKIPELGFRMYNTSVKLRVFLEKEGIRYRFPYAYSGIVAEIGHGAPYVALRANSDAVAIQEPEHCLFRSQNDGAMHAAGHDAQVAMLMGAARILKAHEAELGGTVQLFFQPAEEGEGGADKMIREGAAQATNAVFALRLEPSLPSGTVATRSGAFMAGSYSFTFTIHGKGIYAATPAVHKDPASAAAAAVLAVQALVAKEASSSVIAINRLAVNSAFAVTPDVATFGGHIRGPDAAGLKVLKASVVQKVAGVAAEYDCISEVNWHEQDQPYYPPTINNEEVTALGRDVATKLFGSSAVQEAKPSLDSDGLGFFCELVPCSLVLLGVRKDDAAPSTPLHTSRFVLDESVLCKGTALSAAFAVEYIQAHKPKLGLASIKSETVLASTKAAAKPAEDIETSDIAEAPSQAKEEL